jgi:ATP-dependent DNA helicase RecG
MELVHWRDRTKFRKRYINPLIELNILKRTVPDKPQSPMQKYLLTEKGTAFLDLLKTNHST